jgi:hypothetical protein
MHYFADNKYIHVNVNKIIIKDSNFKLNFAKKKGIPILFNLQTFNFRINGTP